MSRRRMRALCLKPTMGVCTAANAKKTSLTLLLVTIGTCFGVMLNFYGFVFERIRVDVVLRAGDATADYLGRNISDDSIIAPTAERYSDFVVPNIVHFIWFAENKKMTFINYVSILSAHKIQKPDVIMFHCDHLPQGEWWDRLSKEVPLKIVHRDPPAQIHGQKLLHMYHKGDVAKIEILLKYGGIYLDYDVIVIQSLDPLRHYDVTLGKEKPPKFIAGIIVARKGAAFLQIWYESYRENYRPLDWDYNCARVTYQLYRKRPDLLHVEKRRFTTPDWQDRHLLWNEVINWRDLYVLHVMQHLSWKEYTPDDIKSLNSTFGEVMRFIYHGSPTVIS